jgi:predicted metal-binding membrane protein
VNGSHRSILQNEDDGWLRHKLDSPHLLAWVGFGVLVFCAWIFLAAMSFAASDGQVGFVRELLASLCAVSTTAWSSSDLALAFAMWMAMTFAMMLPAGAPMLATYMDIAGAGKRKGLEIPSAGVLAAGYLAVWGVFAVAATVAQWGLASAGELSPALKLASPWIGAGVLIGAGAWQFSATKHNCLTKCRRPFTWFMANWRDDTRGVLAMGLRQGIICLGCCWALMAVMFVAGLMNLVWMAVLAIVMVSEKVLPNPKPLVYGTGIVLILTGIGVIASTLFV